MSATSPTSLKNSVRKRNQVSDAEKQLWACIHSKGLLDNDVKDLYHKACGIYETLFLSDNELPDLQHIEYLLWRLHYKHIDEFRKMISQNSAEQEDKQSSYKKLNQITMSVVDKYMEGFKFFLSEATKFYQGLIRKIKRYYGLFEEPWFYKNDGVSGRIGQTQLHKCQFVCHRLCICLGDLARYLELYGKPDPEQQNWSIAATHYLEAAKIFPDSGNPHNQLAVLATYIRDELLALYHCIRSLAVQEPFPDALQNLMLLFERNRSIDISFLSSDVHNLSKRSEWISSQSTAHANGSCLNSTSETSEGYQTMALNLWPLIIRTTSFFFLESSLDSFPGTFASTVKELEIVLALDVTELSSALESYQNLNISKAGPYRSLHIVSVLLFIIHKLFNESEPKSLKPENEVQPTLSVKWALTATFMFMGRFVDRCLKGGPVIYFPLLPALLVFIEWLVGTVDKLYLQDENCEATICYFFASLVDLLNRLLEVMRDQAKFPDHIALWEDYELRGFLPLSHTHLKLDFSSHWEEEINYKMKNEYRAYRIIQAAMRMAKKSNDNARKWLFYSQKDGKFSTEEQKSCSEEEAKESHEKVYEKFTIVGDEEEEIVFKPITRHNSEPIQLTGQEVASSTSDQCLRRASSVLVAQNRALINSFTFHSTNTLASSNKQPGVLHEAPIAVGPPSLSSWVRNGDELLLGERGKKNEIDRRVLKPIDEMASIDFGSLCISSPFSAPVPSAPLLPENSIWLTHTSTGFSSLNAATYQPNSFVPSSNMYFYTNPADITLPAPSTPNMINYPQTFLEPKGSYAWNSPQFPKLGDVNVQRIHNVIQDQQCTRRELNDALGAEASRFDLLDGWTCNPTMFPNGGPPLLRPSSALLRGLHDQRSDILFPEYQRPIPYISPAMTATRPEQQPQPFMEYIKQRECPFQSRPQFTGSPYMQN